jgi:hypothetical protein
MSSARFSFGFFGDFSKKKLLQINFRKWTALMALMVVLFLDQSPAFCDQLLQPEFVENPEAVKINYSLGGG